MRSWEEKPHSAWKLAEFSSIPRPPQGDDQASEGLAMRADCPGRMINTSVNACIVPGTLSSGLGSAAANVPGLSLERQGGLGGLGKKRPQWV